MKNKYSILLGAVVATPLLMTTSCIEETFPTNGATQEQIEESTKAAQAIVWGMPGHMNVYGIVSPRSDYDFGNPGMMQARNVMTADMVVEYAGGYDWFAGWSRVNASQDDLYTNPAFTWLYYYEQVLACNNCVKSFSLDTTNPDEMAYLGAGLAFRAATYLDMARMYEFLPAIYKGVLRTTNDDGKEVVGLTCPIVTEKTSEADARNNPRAPHNEMVAFIKEDLENAIKLLKNASPRMAKTLPNLAVAYGLMARLYLWDASYCDPDYNTASDKHSGNGDAAQLYAKAAEYANLAITTSGATPMTQDQCLSTTNGFNDLSASSWMWGQQLVAEDACVKSGIRNWTSFLSNETDFGYAGAGAYVSIGASLYNEISDRDFRKLEFVAPGGSKLSGQESYINPTFAQKNFTDYYSLKFRPGSGNMNDPQVGCAVGIPLMRVEEMYLIEAEAIAHSNASAGLEKLISFMKAYRYPTYRTEASSKADIIEEIILQKRIELWGEGQAYYDVKRLNMSVIRAYAGSNFDPSSNAYNTTGRPAWMNIVIPRNELNNNAQLTSLNNPSPVGAVALGSM